MHFDHSLVRLWKLLKPSSHISRWSAMRALRRRRLVYDIWERLRIISTMVGDQIAENKIVCFLRSFSYHRRSSPIIADHRWYMRTRLKHEENVNHWVYKIYLTSWNCLFKSSRLDIDLKPEILVKQLVISVSVSIFNDSHFDFGD